MNSLQLVFCRIYFWVRAAIDRLLFSYRYNQEVYLSLVFTVPGLMVGTVPEGVAEILGLLIAFGSLLLFLWFLFQRLVVRAGYYLKETPTFPPPGLAKAAKAYGYVVSRHGGGLLIEHPELSRLFSTSSTPLKIERRRYELPGQTPEFYGAIFEAHGVGLRTWNESKVRICSDLSLFRVSNGMAATVQQSDYYSGVVTNQTGRQLVCSKGDLEQFSGEAMFFVDGEILTLEDSPASNHVGISSLCITRDLRLVYQLQGRNRVDENKHAPTGSGSLDWEDIGNARKLLGREPSLEDVVIHGMQREQWEEVGISCDPARVLTRLTGYCRYLHRGGKPEFFGLGVVNQNFSELKVRKCEIDRVREIRFIQLDNLGTSHVRDRMGHHFDEWREHRDMGVSWSMAFSCALGRLENEPEDFLLRMFAELGVIPGAPVGS